MKIKNGWKLLFYGICFFSYNFVKSAQQVSKGSVVIEEEKVTLDLDDKGFPTVEALKKLVLEQYFVSKPIASDSNMLAKQDRAFLVEGIQIIPVKGGYYSEKVYEVSVPVLNVQDKKKKIFFLKVSSKPESTQHLIEMQKGMIGEFKKRAKILKISPRKLPVITWVEKVFIYSYLGKDRAIEMTHAAQGEQGTKIFNNGSTLDVIEFGYRVGLTLGSFQQIFMNDKNRQSNPADWTTVCHKDLHFGNIFYDKKTKQVYWIDNETMSDVCCWDNDIVYLLVERKSYNKIHFFRAFIEGYLNSFQDIYKKGIIACYLGIKLGSYISVQEALKADNDPLFLEKIILGQLGKSISIKELADIYLKINKKKKDNLLYFALQKGWFDIALLYLEQISDININELFGMYKENYLVVLATVLRSNTTVDVSKGMEIAEKLLDLGIRTDIKGYYYGEKTAAEIYPNLQSLIDQNKLQKSNGESSLMLKHALKLATVLGSNQGTSLLLVSDPSKRKSVKKTYVSLKPSKRDIKTALQLAAKLFQSQKPKIVVGKKSVFENWYQVNRQVIDNALNVYVKQGLQYNTPLHDLLVDDDEASSLTKINTELRKIGLPSLPLGVNVKEAQIFANRLIKQMYGTERHALLSIPV